MGNHMVVNTRGLITADDTGAEEGFNLVHLFPLGLDIFRLDTLGGFNHLFQYP